MSTRHERDEIHAIEDEARRLRRVRITVDVITSLIMQGRFSRAEGEALVRLARRRILALFPGRDETYELLYARRFERLLHEYTRPDHPGPLAPGGLRWRH